MKKISPFVIIALILTSMLPIVAQGVSAEETSQTQRTPAPKVTDENHLLVFIEENVTVQENAFSQITIAMNIPQSPLAEIYRKALGAPTNASVDEVMAIPESVPLDDNSNVMIPVKQPFYKSIQEQQLYSLGIKVNISDSKMMPKNCLNEFKVWLTGNGLLPISNVTKIDQYDKLKITIGPKDTNMTMELAIANIQLVQMMLESLTGEQVYEYQWTTRVKFPESAILLNNPKFQSWRIDFGIGTHMTATVVSEGASTIVLDEKTVIEEDEITATPESLREGFNRYKLFDIEVLLPNSKTTYSSNENVECVDDWSYPFTLLSWEGTMQFNFVEEPLSAKLEASASLDVTGQIAWDFDWHGLKMFESWIKVEATIQLKFHAEASASYSKKWTYPLWPEGLTVGHYDFFVPVFGVPVPVSVTVRLNAVGTFTFNAFGTIQIDAQANGDDGLKPVSDGPEKQGGKVSRIKDSHTRLPDC
jgi:hypothetical protein